MSPALPFFFSLMDKDKIFELQEQKLLTSDHRSLVRQLNTLHQVAVSCFCLRSMLFLNMHHKSDSQARINETTRSFLRSRLQNKVTQSLTMKNTATTEKYCSRVHNKQQP